MSRVLILGGVGFIGRNLVEYLAKNKLASFIRVADKAMPGLVGLSKAQTEIFNSPLVEYKQANLNNAASVAKVFDGGEGGKFDFVVNLASETKYSQTAEVYKENVVDLAVKVATEAAKQGVKKYIEVSTAQVYDAGKKASTEDSKIKPWTKLAKSKLEAEEAIKKINGLNYVILRPAIVYGPGDTTGITPRLIIASTYKYMKEKMEFLWTKDLKINTVHIEDTCAAIWHLCQKGEVGSIYNLADTNNTDQGSVNVLLEQIFKIKTSFVGAIGSKVATSVAMKTVAETANDKHLKPWSELCKANGILDTPLTPYLDEELLYNNSFSIDGSKITKEGFEYKHPKMTEKHLRDVLDHFIQLKFFPAKALE